MQTSASTLRQEGNQFFQKKDFENALDKYTQAIALTPKDRTHFNNPI
jgi:Flp pilus assembly protein TadD